MYKRQHFHTFDALRFFAFFIVFVSHIPLPKLWNLHTYHIAGSVGVYFFFVLSGFLISYILLVEKLNTESIKFTRFLWRRALRIWPLFYGMIAFAFLTPYILSWIGLEGSNDGYEPNWFMSCLFLENYNMMIAHSFPNVSPLRVMWSLCIEEHFYILWVIIFRYISIKNIPLLVGIAILVANITRLIYWNMDIDTMDLFSNIDYFALGALLAYVILLKPHYLNVFNRVPKYIKWISVVIIGCSVFVLPEFLKPFETLLIPLIYGPLFVFVLISTLTKQNVLKVRNSNVLSRLGIYTYGLYLFHTICINLMLKISPKIGVDPEGIKGYLVVFVASLLMSIVFSYLSFEWFEKQFLKLKNKT